MKRLGIITTRRGSLIGLVVFVAFAIILLMQQREGINVTKHADPLQVADTHMVQYAAAERLHSARFQLVAKQIDAHGMSTFDYEYQGSPKHLLRVYVKKDNTVEINRMIE